MTGDPPHSVEAEQGALGSMLISPNEAIREAINRRIEANHFYIPAHQTIYTALRDLWDADAPIDLITFTQVLRDLNLLESVGGASFVTHLFTFVPAAANVGFYLDIVQEKHRRRALMAAASSLGARAQDEAVDLEETVAEVQQRLVALQLESKNGSKPDAVSLMSLADVTPDMAKTLLGNRFLCMGGGLLFVGPSGIGKSSASVQQDIQWALGRPAFGIYPARPLRMLCIQAENDDGDLGEMARGVCEGLHLSNGDRSAIRDQVLYVSERTHTGLMFLTAVVAPLLGKHRPDILRLDPLLAYLGDDVNDQRSTAAFLRTGLNPLLEQFNCAAIINHHTPKVINRDTSGWRASDWMYSGAGSADLTNWCRAALVIDPTFAPCVFRFIAAKRGGRVGWRDKDDGSTIYERMFCHETGGGLCWHEATAADLAEVESNKQKRKNKTPPKTKDDFMALVPAEGAISKNMLMSWAQDNDIGEKRTRGFLSELIETGDLHEWRIPRPRTNPEIRISRQQQPLI